MVMKLSCVRCKQKKIKCNKCDERCGQCAAVYPSAECIYMERKKRLRLAQQKLAVGDLARRLESIEKQINTTEYGSPSSLPTQMRESPDDTTPTDHSTTPSGRVMTEGGPESWIYRLANDARHNFEKVNTQSQLTSALTPASTVGPAMTALDEALEDLGKLRIRSDQGILKDHAFQISSGTAKACINAFIEILGSMVVLELIVNSFELDILKALPDVINSPFVSIDPALRVLYYNGLFYGLHKMHGPGNEFSQGAYYKCLEAVPAWLDAATGSEMDIYAAAITCWTSVQNFDYLLSWKFHVKSCQFLKNRGIDQLDVLPAKTHAEEEERQTRRFLYWHILQTDLVFRLFYNKPSALQWSPNAVKPPTIFSPRNMQPSVPHTVLHVFWIRFTVLMAEVYEILNATSDVDHEHLSQDVETYCSKMESLIEECNMVLYRFLAHMFPFVKPDDGAVLTVSIKEHYMKSPKTDATLAYLFADQMINTYASIIGVKRKARRLVTDHQVDAITLRSARKIISLILQFDIWRSDYVETDFVFVHFISFYPFCAVFSLYENILASSDPDTCEEDVQSLERTGAAMKKACKVHPEYVPITNTILALNKVCRTTQDSRRHKDSPSIDAIPNTSVQPLADLIQLPSPSQLQRPTTSRGLNPPASFALGDIPGSDLPFSFPQDLSLDSGEFHPMGAMRALENEFIERNWHETWWDMNGDMDMGLESTPS
ncbi:hypothetical protein P154DRAFT_582758 [Amniculicola lignicola CBS 123094]|uniref:Zn(2)-C6 fungal-type domain-containing protein n=1 Tax=Amniculicola lignicola CBS 123094 TaxID=1392246 RepID=A0A6A5VVT2_9PLEO|nr:hypothetical protein P154DRAFT_582758 [Amniculicola lignicola CBS 123094]